MTLQEKIAEILMAIAKDIRTLLPSLEGWVKVGECQGFCERKGLPIIEGEVTTVKCFHYDDVLCPKGYCYHPDVLDCLRGRNEND